jgi:WD40 repeat protein/tRNA A-37 threonylcarbamoyl transferase component Bud32
MDNRISDDSEIDQLLDEVATAYLKAREAGQAPDREAWLERFPDLAAELREFFADQDRFDRLATPLRPLALSSWSDSGATPQPATTLSETLPLLPTPPRSFGDYTVLAMVGRGGMGVVWKARQKRPDRLVALKMFRASDLAAPTDVQRFRNEAEVIAQLDHPNIVPIYDVGECDGVHYFSMKLVEGGSLADHLERFRSDPRAAARLLLTIARAVHYAHQRGILHRDLKPSNIILDSAGKPHITDFGLAKQVQGSDNLTHTGEIVGTPTFMAPEQARGETLTTAADVYGLGAVLYTMLAGRPPFRGSSALATLNQVTDFDPESPTRYNPRLDRDLATVCLKCLEKEPTERYESAQALAEDLECWLDGKPVEARPVGSLGRFRRWCVRKPGLATLTGVSGVLVLLLLGGLAASTWLIAKQRDLAEVAHSRTLARERELTQLLQAARLKQAHQAWERGSLGEMDRLLEQCRPGLADGDSRNFVWHYLWRLGHDFPKPTVLYSHQGDAYHVTFDPQGKTMASAGRDGMVGLWDLAAKAVIKNYKVSRKDCNEVAFAPDGQAFATASEDGTARVWDRATGKEEITFGGHRGEVVSVAFCPDGKSLASAGQDKLVRIWERATGRERCALSGHQSRIESLAFSRDGRMLASVGGVERPQPTDGQVILWDLSAGEARFRWQMAGAFRCVAFSPDGGLLAAAGDGSMIYLWETATGKPRSGWPAAGRIQSLAFSKDGALLACGADDRRVRVWDMATGKQRYLSTADASLWCVAFTPDGHALVSADREGAVKQYDLNEFLPRRSQEGSPMALSPNGKHLVLYRGEDRPVALWDANRREVCWDFAVAARNTRTATFHLDGKTLLTVSEEGTPRLWNTLTGDLLEELPSVPANFRAVAFAPDGHTMAVCQTNGT